MDYYRCSPGDHCVACRKEKRMEGQHVTGCIDSWDDADNWCSSSSTVPAETRIDRVKPKLANHEGCIVDFTK